MNIQNKATLSVDLIHPHGLQIRLDTPKGRGVFATCKIPAGVVIDISPVLILPTHESEGTLLAHYTYTWPAEGDVIIPNDQKSLLSSFSKSASGAKVARQALALGLGSMFNHTRRPNIGWERDIPRQTIRYYTLRDVEEGEELCISYGPKLWFDDADGPEEGNISDDEDNVMSLQADVFSDVFPGNEHFETKDPYDRDKLCRMERVVYIFIFESSLKESRNLSC